MSLGAIRCEWDHQVQKPCQFCKFEPKYFGLFFVFFSQGLASNAVIAKVNGELWDLDRPLEGDCTLELLTFDDEEAQAVNKSVFYLMKRVCVTELIAALCFLNVVLKKK